MTEPRRYQPVPIGQGVCAACGSRGPARTDRDGAPVRRHRHHLPDGTACPERACKPWIEAVGLPTWGDLSDLDRGAAIMHCWARHTQGPIQARDHHPARFHTDPLLRALTPYDASRYAAEVCGSYAEITARIGEPERERLYELAYEATVNTTCPSPLGDPQ